jgi:hypothetical protein
VGRLSGPGAAEPGAERAARPGHAAAAGDGHAVVAELRGLALLVLDRLDPLLARLRDAVADDVRPGDAGDREPAADSRSGATPCTACPICAALAAVRRDHPDLGTRLAASATELAGALREAIADDAAGHPPPQPRPVQRIRVDREPLDGEGAPC